MRLNGLVLGLAIVALFGCSAVKSPAEAQDRLKTIPCTDAGAPSGVSQNGRCIPTQFKDTTGWAVDVTAANPLPVTASVTIAGFAPATTGTAVSATTGGNTQTLPAGTVVVATNVGTTNAAYCKLGASATTADQYISPGGGWFAFTVGANTQITCVTSTSTTTVNTTGGAGLPTGTGGGSGSGGGGAVTVADGADVTLGAKADAKSTATDSTAITAMQVLKQISASAQLSATASNQTSEASLITSTNTFLNNLTGTKAAGTAAANSALVGGVYNSSPITLTNGQQSAVQFDANGYAKVNVAAGGAGGGAVYGPTAVGSAAANPPVLVAGTANATATGNVQVWKVDSSGYGQVTVTNNGSAQGAAIAGQTPSTIACQVLTSGPSVFTTATTQPCTQDEYGGVLTHPYALQDRLVKGTTSAMTGTTSTSLVAAPGAGLKNYITTLSCVNSHATVGTFVTVQDGSGGTAIWTVAAAALFGGTAITFPAPLQQPTANTALFVADVTTGANVICSASGYKAP